MRGSVPDSAGKLSPEEKQKALDWVNRHWEGRSQACPICGNSQWVIGEHLVQPITLGEKHHLMLGGGPGYPLIQVISIPCGYTVFVNAVIAGVVLGDVPKETTKATEPEGK
jgi:hypothetical protein